MVRQYRKRGPPKDIEQFKQNIRLLLEGDEEWIVIPEEQIRQMSTNDLYLAERRMYFEGHPIETRSFINIQKELKRRGGLSGW